MALGGEVPGTGSHDTVPAMLTPGEFVLTADRVRAYGQSALHALNQGLADIVPRGSFALPEMRIKSRVSKSTEIYWPVFGPWHRVNLPVTISHDCSRKNENP
ncbi:MAG: hypothetical protein GY862_12625, partial [Gammaproteobacteria bacterium]|nr:hypothetical protein [Gammaproteobacteria bacterium]